jgi:DNA mismatch repair protein MutS
VELSTGRFFAAAFSRERLTEQIARIDPAECLVNEEDATAPAFGNDRAVYTRRPAWTFAASASAEALARHFGTASLEGFGFDATRDAPAIRAAGAIIDYLGETQKSSLAHIDRLTLYQASQTLEIDESSRRSLEITRTLRDGRREGSLLGVLDTTATAMGARLLSQWLASPLVCAQQINARLEAVAELTSDLRVCDELRDKIRGVYDLERLLSRVVTARATPRDLASVGRTLALVPAIKAKLAGRKSALLSELEAALDLCPELRARLDAALVDECPLTSREGGIVRAGFSAELDNLRELATGGKQWIARYQAQEIERTGIPSLKVGFNKVFGYYLEVTHTHGGKVPDHYIRKQTVKNAERYITPELKEYEEKVLSADEKSKELEYDLFCQLREQVAACAKRLQATAAVLAQLDVLVSLATVARARGYCRPTIVEEPVLSIVDGRHPVVDAIAPAGSFVPNDAACGGDEGLILLITGPNMAGKSTYIRQVALITLMAQIGSFVPARQATIGIADRIFARVGASDELARGQSTFMVEMTETARILNMATPRSLVILDEIGRGTSTYDGVSLAWAIVEHLHDQTRCRTLFATHYHELTDLAATLPAVRNLNVAVREWDEQLVFLHKIVEGAADKSYGIHVARLAGVPREVNERAKQILAQLEQEHLNGDGKPKIALRKKSRARSDLQLTFFAPYEHPLLERIRAVDLDATAPRDALALLQQWQHELTKEKEGGRRTEREN